jgi:glycosyltransferase involved in cell wall biosynthesis
MIRIASTLQEAGYQINLIGRKIKGRPELPAYPFKTHLHRCYFSKGIPFYLELNLRLFIQLIFHKPDAVYAVDFDTLPAARGYHLFFSKPFVFDAHELFTDVPELQNRPFKQWIWNMVGKKIIPKATFSLTVSESLVRLLSQKYAAPFVLIRNFPTSKSIDAVDISQRRKNKWIYYQGMLHEGRGIELLIQTMLLLPDWTLILAGNGDKEAYLKDLSKQLGVETRVMFKGMVEPAELIQWAKEAWLGVNILENQSLSYYYSLANKTFDYFQAWLPAIHTDFPEYRILAEKHQCITLLKQAEPALLAKTVEAIWANPPLYENMVAAAAQAATQYTWEQEAGRLLDTFAIYFPLPKANLHK